MSQYYATTGSRASVKTLDGQTVIDVEAIGIATKPSGVRFTVPVPKAAYDAGDWNPYLETAARLVEGLIAANPDAGQQLVSGGSGNQQIDSNGLLAYFITFVVSYTPLTTGQGTFETTVTLPVSLFETAAAFDAGIGGTPTLIIIEDAYNNLKKTAAA